MIIVVSATKFSESEFWGKSALGLSLTRLRFDARINSKITFENSLGLPHVYNAQIVTGDLDDVLVFVHDDVWLDDCFFADRILDGLKVFDVIGIAGNQRRVPSQPVWIALDLNFTFDDESNLSGAVCLGQTPCGPVRYFGPSSQSCELLDGVFFATTRSALVKKSVYFDARFNFHFYDLDFCRAARLAGLSLGTWPISMTHQSEGLFGTESWNEMYHRYIEKWKD